MKIYLLRIYALLLILLIVHSLNERSDLESNLVQLYSQLITFKSSCRNVLYTLHPYVLLDSRIE